MKRIFVKVLFISTINFLYSQNSTNLSASLVNSMEIKKDLTEITQTSQPRNYRNIPTLNKVATYIYNEFDKVCDSVGFQDYRVYGNIYKNVIGSIGIKNKKRIIVGAHYDVAGDSEGADDNASGVVGLLELARLLSKEDLKYRIDFVAYTLEEPPFFRTKEMGSYKHAKYLFDNKIPIKGMICLETIGFYSDKPNSQEYPIVGMELIYGNKGNFITVVKNKESGGFSEQIGELMKNQKLIDTKLFKGSSLIQGIDFSDHLNYWNFNYDAVMITNTAFYRNKNYHTLKDKMETLDIQKLSSVIEQLYISIKEVK